MLELSNTLTRDPDRPIYWASLIPRDAIFPLGSVLRSMYNMIIHIASNVMSV